MLREDVREMGADRLLLWFAIVMETLTVVLWYLAIEVVRSVVAFTGNFLHDSDDQHLGITLIEILGTVTILGLALKFCIRDIGKALKPEVVQLLRNVITGWGRLCGRCPKRDLVALVNPPGIAATDSTNENASS